MVHLAEVLLRESGVAEVSIVGCWGLSWQMLGEEEEIVDPELGLGSRVQRLFE